MEIKNFIFLTLEGYTFQPDSESIEPDIENLQVVGFARGRDSKEAFQQLLKESSFLIDTSFDEIFSYELSQDYERNKAFYSLSELRK